MEDFCLWEKQSGESSQAFETFCIYRDLGSKRSVSAVYTELSKSRQLISRWKQKFDWDKRAAAYDNAIESEARKEAVRSKGYVGTAYRYFHTASEKGVGSPCADKIGGIVPP